MTDSYDYHQVSGMFKVPLNFIRETQLAQLFSPLKGQRPIDEERALLQLKPYILENYNDPSYESGIIRLSRKATGDYKVIDGQHRLRALCSITDSDMKNHNIDELMIWIDVRDNMTYQNEKNWFLAANSGQPMARLYLTPDDKKSYADAVNNQLRSPDMFQHQIKPSNRCRKPNIYINDFIDELCSDSDGDLLQMYHDNGDITDMDNPSELIDGIMDLNDYLESKLTDAKTGIDFFITCKTKKCKTDSSRATTALKARKEYPKLMEKINRIHKSYTGATLCYLGMFHREVWKHWIFNHANISRIQM